MRVFLAGIMQGSHRAAALHDQDYRTRLSRLLTEHLPGIEIYDPLADHQNSLDYNDELACDVFMRHNRLCGEVDIVLAFVPEASMGTAIEMWEAYRHNKIVLTISPLEHNWAIKYCSHKVYQDFDTFEQALVAGDVAQQIDSLLASGGHAEKK